MQYTITINLLKATEWGLNLQQAALFGFLYELSSWADCHIINGCDYRWITYSKIILEMPILSQHKDTIYRHMKALTGKGLIEIQQQGSGILVRTTTKGKAWNRDLGKKSEGSEKNPSNLGEKSEPPSEKNPTYHNTTYPLTKSKNHTTPPPPAYDHQQEAVEEYIRRETDRAAHAGEIRKSRVKYAAGIRKQINREGGDLTPERREQLKQWRFSTPIAPCTIPTIDPDAPSGAKNEAKIQDHEIRARTLARLPPWEQEIVRTRKYLKETCGE